MLMKLKDYFTAGNIVCGGISTFLVIEGVQLPQAETLVYLNWAAYFIMFGWIFDVLDGVVARLTKQFNKFGSEFDNIADLVNYSVAPSALIYAWYGFIIDPTLKGKIIAGVLALMPAVMGSIRIARFNIKRIEYPGIWFGLPRPASAFLIVNLFGLRVFNSYPQIGYLVIPLLAYLNVGLVPFIGHHKRKMNKYWIIVMVGAAVIIISSWLISLFTDFKYFFETTYLFFGAYAILAYPVLTSKEEKRKIKEFLINWKKEESEEL